MFVRASHIFCRIKRMIAPSNYNPVSAAPQVGTLHRYISKEGGCRKMPFCAAVGKKLSMTAKYLTALLPFSWVGAASLPRER